MSFFKNLGAAIAALLGTAVILGGVFFILALATLLPVVLGILGFIVVVYFICYESLKTKDPKKPSQK